MHAIGSVIAALALAATPLTAQRATLTITRELLLSGAEHDFVPIAVMVVDGRGRMHVWQDQDERIRRFEMDGREIAPIGRAGEGPGEFRMRSMGGMVGDTLWVSDPMLRRTSFFLPDGKLLRTQAWAFGVTRGEEYYPAGIGVQPIVVEPRGTQITDLYRVRGIDLPTWWGPEGTRSVQVRVHPDGTLLNVVSRVSDEIDPCIMALTVPGRSESTIRIPFCQGSPWRQAFEADRMVRVSVDSSQRGRFVVEATRLDGTPVYRTAFEQSLVRIPREVADSARRSNMAPRPSPFPDIERARTAAYARMRLPEFYRAVTDVYVGHDGSAWVGLRRKARERDWLVFTPEGRIRGVVALPASFDMMHADAQRIWGTVLDDDELPSVVRYRVHGGN